MLRGKRIACVLSTSLLLSTYGTQTTPFLPMATEVVKNNNEMVQNLRLNKFQEQIKKYNIELETKKTEETKQVKKQKINEPQWQTFVVSFYTGLDEENFENCGGKNCLNEPLERGMIANNSLPMGTKIYLDNDYGIRTVADKGSSRFNSDNRIDLYVARYDGESKEQWRRRANSYGIKYIRGYILK